MTYLDKPLIDHRIYTTAPGKLAEFMKLSEEKILPLQAKYCGNCIFYSTSESGVLNQLIQAWAYEDAADRDRRRAGGGGGLDGRAAAGVADGHGRRGARPLLLGPAPARRRRRRPG